MSLERRGKEKSPRRPKVLLLATGVSVSAALAVVLAANSNNKSSGDNALSEYGHPPKDFYVPTIPVFNQKENPLSNKIIVPVPGDAFIPDSVQSNAGGSSNFTVDSRDLSPVKKTAIPTGEIPTRTPTREPESTSTPIPKAPPYAPTVIGKENLIAGKTEVSKDMISGTWIVKIDGSGNFLSSGGVKNGEMQVIVERWIPQPAYSDFAKNATVFYENFTRFDKNAILIANKANFTSVIFTISKDDPKINSYLQRYKDKTVLNIVPLPKIDFVKSEETFIVVALKKMNPDTKKEEQFFAIAGIDLRGDVLAQIKAIDDFSQQMASGNSK